MQVGDVVRIVVDTPEGSPYQPYVFDCLGQILFVIKGHWYTVRMIVEDCIYTFYETEIVKANIDDIRKLFMEGYALAMMHK